MSAVGLAVGLGTAYLASEATKDAASAQAGAANRANQISDSQYQQTRTDMAPWRNAGGSAIGQLAYLLGLPGYGPSAAQPAGSLSAIGRRAAGTLPPGSPASGATLPAPSPIGGKGDSMAYGVVNQMSPTEPGGIFDPASAPGQLGAGGSSTLDYAYNPKSQTWEPAAGAAYNPQLGDFGSLSRDFSMSDFQADPGYQFRFDEGQKALERSAAAKGRALGGGTLKALTRYGQDMGSQEYGNAFNRFQTNRNTRFNQLAAVAGIGQTANGQLAQLGQTNALSQGNNLMGAANAQGAAGIAGANAWGTALNNGYNNWLTYQSTK